MQQDALALRYRPHTFGHIAGQRHVQLMLYHMVRRDRCPSAMLFAGNRGSGKTSTARILGAALNCPVWRENPAVVAGRDGSMPCGSCDSCLAVQDGSSVDVIEVDAASNGTVDAIRELRNAVRYEAAGSFRVVLLDEAHSMSGPAFNALLKLLEEPPDRLVIVLLTTEPGKILPTVASRCMPFEFKRIAVADIVKRLRTICEGEAFPAEEALLYSIAERSGGALRDAIMLLDQCSRVDITSAVKLANLRGDSDFAPKLVTAMADGNYGQVYGIAREQLMRNGDYQAVSTALVSCLKDILALHADGQIDAQGDALAARRTLKERITAAQAAGAMVTLWNLLTKTRMADPGSSLDLALAYCTEGLHPRPQAVPAAANGHSHMSLVTSSRESLAALGIRPA